MKTNKLKLPLTLTFLVCVLVLAFTATYNINSVPAIAGAKGNQVVVLDPGHGGLDSGCVGKNGQFEKDINLAIALNLKELLIFSGFDVVLTRDEDISIYDDGVVGIRNQKISDMENRKEIVDSCPDSIFLSIHQNQYTEPQYFGGQMFYTTRNKDNFKLAQIMQKNFASLQTGNDREVKLIDNDLFLFKDAAQPALLIECGFLSNENDLANLSDQEYQKKVSFIIYKSLMEYLETVKPVAEPPEEQADSDYTQSDFIEKS